jgi:4-amino-4-deoxy-L-arabinose transferase-like glycosyltransferase
MPAVESDLNPLSPGDLLPLRRNYVVYLVVSLVAAAIYLACIVSPPSLMDDVDAVHAQMARTMLASGDYVTAHLDGVPYLEKAPLLYWLIAGFYKIFHVSDVVARLPIALSAIGLACLVAAFGVWAFGKRAGFYAGLVMATCIGIFLFTRILIPDVMLTLTMTLSLWAFLRALDTAETRPRLWAAVSAAAIGTGLLLKSLIALVFPIGAALLYLLFTYQLFSRATWKRLHPFTGTLIVLLIAAPWHILATLRNPPYFAFTLHSGPGQYRGFLWFYFINEQLLRFLNLRYPRDYNTVPRALFWGLHLVWLFPWSVYFPAIAKLSLKPDRESNSDSDRATRTRLLALCWAGLVLVFFTFSTTQEYYSMPCYPALALLLGSAMALHAEPTSSRSPRLLRLGTHTFCAITALCALATIAILIHVRDIPAPGDISQALVAHPANYKLSLGHMTDLTLDSFAYLRIPLAVAAVAFLIGALGTFRARGQRAFLAAALMMVIFFQAARLALVVFDPYMSSRPLANAFLHSPAGDLIIEHHYYTFSSVVFYTDRPALLLNGRRQNLEYGSYAPGAPDPFISDTDFARLWSQPQRYYIVTTNKALDRLRGLAGSNPFILVLESGGKSLYTNHPL